MQKNILVVDDESLLVEMVSRVFACGADGFLAKPFLLGELLHQTNKCLHRQQPEKMDIMAAADPRDTVLLPDKFCCA